jgi:magnesium-transporting ATPase (P-type)
VFERVGEATEVALRVLTEKLNVTGVDRASLSREELAHSSADALKTIWNKEFTMEFSRDRKSMSVYCTPITDGPSLRTSKGPKLFVKGAPEGIIERCSQLRVGSETITLTDSMRNDILSQVTAYGTGKDTLRCLALATCDSPLEPSQMDLADASKFAKYESNLTFVGVVGMLDPPREEVKAAIQSCREAGIRVIVITGDNKNTAEAICRRIGVFSEHESTEGISFSGREFDDLSESEQRLAFRQARLFSRVEPSHKAAIVEYLQGEDNEVCAMTGDGVNDAPALKKSKIGIAIAGSTDAARAASDIVLTEEGLSTIVEGIIISRCIFQRMKNFITYRIAATLQLLVFFFIAVLTFKPSDYQPSDETDDDVGGAWPDFFKLPVLMLMLITLLNDGTLISVGYDNVTPSSYPNVWNLPVLFVISSVLAGVALLSSLLLLYMLLSSWDSNSVLKSMGIGELQYGQIITAMYLKISISDFLTLFSARTHDGFFWSSKPSPILLGGACLALSVSTIIACTWPDSNVDDEAVEGLAHRSPKAFALYVWLYCIFFWFIQDGAKVLAYWYMHKQNILGINDASARKVSFDQSDNKEDNLKTNLLSNAY